MRLFKNNVFAMLFLFIAVLAFAEGVPEKHPTDNVTIGIPTSTDDKTFTVDTGDGVNNPTITIDMTNKDFDLNKALNVVNAQMSLGDGTNVDTTFVFDVGLGAANPKFRYVAAESALFFANNGVDFKKIGSGGGGGGGVNLLNEANFDCESGDPPNDYTASGGTFDAETNASDIYLGDQSCRWDSSALSQTVRTLAITVPDGLKGRSCSARVQFKTSAADEIIFRVEDSSDVLINEKNVQTSSGWFEEVLFFTCPSSGDMRVELESLVADPAIIRYDNVELGQVGFVNVSQTELIVRAQYDGTTNCNWTTTSSSLAAFGADADCPAITVLHNSVAIDTTDDDLPTLVVNTLPAGRYTLNYDVNWSAASDADITFRLEDNGANLTNFETQFCGGEDPA